MDLPSIIVGAIVAGGPVAQGVGVPAPVVEQVVDTARTDLPALTEQLPDLQPYVDQAVAAVEELQAAVPPEVTTQIGDRIPPAAKDEIAGVQAQLPAEAQGVILAGVSPPARAGAARRRGRRGRFGCAARARRTDDVRPAPCHQHSIGTVAALRDGRHRCADGVHPRVDRAGHPGRVPPGVGQGGVGVRPEVPEAGCSGATVGGEQVPLRAVGSGVLGEGDGARAVHAADVGAVGA